MEQNLDSGMLGTSQKEHFHGESNTLEGGGSDGRKIGADEAWELEDSDRERCCLEGAAGNGTGTSSSSPSSS